MKRRLILAITSFVSSCATPVPYDTTLQSWAGAPEAELIGAWGSPCESYQESGRKFVVFESRRKLHIPSTESIQAGTGISCGTSAVDMELFCSTTFGLDNQTVVSWSSKGNGCNASLVPARRTAAAARN